MILVSISGRACVGRRGARRARQPEHEHNVPGIGNECITVSYNKTKSLKISQEVYYIIIDNFKILNEYNIVNYNAKTMDLFNKHNGKLSFTDSGIITTMKENNIFDLLTFDTQFKKENSINVIDK